MKYRNNCKNSFFFFFFFGNQGIYIKQSQQLHSQGPVLVQNLLHPRPVRSYNKSEKTPPQAECLKEQEAAGGEVLFLQVGRHMHLLL